MNKNLASVFRYGIFGALAALVSYLLVPVAFAVPEPAVSLLVYGAIMAATMYACNRLELKAWAMLSTAKANSAAWRVFVRLSIYLGIPSLALWLAGFAGILVLPAGFITALALTWMPLMVGAWLDFFPARAR